MLPGRSIRWSQPGGEVMERVRFGTRGRLRKLVASGVVGSTVALGAALASSSGVASGQTRIPTTAPYSSAISCSVSGTITFRPPLTASGGGTGSSHISAILSGCTTNSGVVESVDAPHLGGTFATSPFTCSSSSQTSAPFSGLIGWHAKKWPHGGIPPTRVSAGSASGSFAGSTVMNLQVPSLIVNGCVGGRVAKAAVSGTVTVGPACGLVASPMSLYPMAPPICGAQDLMPTSVTSGPDGALWFLTGRSDLIGRTTTGGVTTFYPAPASSPTWGNGAVTTGPDGALWFVADGGTAIGRMTTSGAVTTYPVPDGGVVDSLTCGPDDNVWFTVDNNQGNNQIGDITPSGQFTMFTDSSFGTADWSSPDHRFVEGIARGPDGALWFTSFYAANQGSGWIGRITTSGAVSEYTIPYAGVYPYTLTTGADGALWFAGYGVIGRVTTAGQFSEYTAPGDIGQVLGMAAGPDGAVWFTNYSIPGDTGFYPFPPVGRITTGGTITTYGDAYVEVGAMSITSGSDGAMWFIDHINDTIGRIAVP
jgi:virginiamycin B lyase